MKVSIGRAAKELGVSRSTLRRWEASGEIEVEQAPNGRRRYDLATLRKLKPPGGPSGRVTLAYARVSRPDQQEALANQVALLESFCTINGWTFEVLKDIGSGVNYCNPGLRELIARVCDGEVCRLIITHRDRLLRLGAELVFSLCERFGTEVVIINASAPSQDPKDLTDDVLDLVAVFSARLYGDREASEQKVMDRLREIAREIASLSSNSLPKFTRTKVLHEHQQRWVAQPAQIHKDQRLTLQLPPKANSRGMRPHAPAVFRLTGHVSASGGLGKPWNLSGKSR